MEEIKVWILFNWEEDSGIEVMEVFSSEEGANKYMIKEGLKIDRWTSLTSYEVIE